MGNYKSKVYKSEFSEKIMKELYKKQLEQISVPFEEKYVETRYGIAHVICYGDPNGEPVLAFHGGNSTNPSCAKMFLPFLNMNKLKVIIPDTIGQIGFSSQERFKGKGLEYGEWASDIIVGLGFKSISCFGISHGAGMLMRLCAVAPQMVKKVVLLVPSGVSNAPTIFPMSKLMIPMFKYLFNPTNEMLSKAMYPLCSERNDEFIELMKLAYKHTHFEIIMPRNVTKKELIKFNSPVYILAGEDDIIFPGKKVLERAKKIFPNLKEAILLTKYKHGDVMRMGDEYTKHYKYISLILENNNVINEELVTL